VAHITSPEPLALDSPFWSLEMFYKELAFAESALLKNGFDGPCTAICSQDWGMYGVKPQNIMSFAVRDVISTPNLPKKTIVIYEAVPETIQLSVGLDVTALQWYPRPGVVGTKEEVLFLIACSYVPMIRKDHCGILHISASR